MQALLSLRQGELSAAQAAVEMAVIDSDPGMMDWLVVPRLVQARVLLAQGASREALGILDDVAGHAAAIHNAPKLVETQALQALAYEALGSTPQALGALTRALEVGLSGGFVRSFVDLGTPTGWDDPMERLLHRLVDQYAGDRLRARPLADYARRLLAVWSDAPFLPIAAEAIAKVPPLSHPRVGAASEAQVETLTDREVEVLCLLARHYSYKDIADQLVITVGTVKTHVNHIYGKLGARSRREALTRAGQQGILSGE